MASSISENSDYYNFTSSSSFPKEEFIFIRHGQTNWSFEQGPQDFSLNERGIQDAENAALILRQVENFDEAIIISSKLNRTCHTASIISELANKTFSTHDDINERDYGNYKNQGNVAESEKAFKQRIIRTFSELLQAEEKKIIVISHAGVFGVLALHLAKEKLKIGFGEVFLFTPDIDKWKVTKLNNI